MSSSTSKQPKNTELSVIKLPKLDDKIKGIMKEFLEIDDEVTKVSEMVKFHRKRLKELHELIELWMRDQKCEAIPLSNGITFRLITRKTRKALTKDNHKDFFRTKFGVTDSTQLDDLVTELYGMRPETEKFKIKLG